VSPGDGGGPGVTSSEAPTAQTASHQAASAVKFTASVAQALRTRRTASYRCAALVCGRRDPLDPLGTRGPSTFSLSADELRAEANRLAGLGWARPEVLERLAVAQVAQ